VIVAGLVVKRYLRIGKAINILYEAINNWSKCSDLHDCRYHALMAIMKLIESKGHKVYAFYKRGDIERCFDSYKDSLAPTIDFYLGHSIYRESVARYNYFRKRKVPMLVYEAGWLYRSTLVDRNKFFGDSFYFNDIKNYINKDFDLQKAEEFRQSLLATGKSKWIQKKEQEIPNVKYVFIPGQVLHDASIDFYSKIGMKEFISTALLWANKHNLHVVYKPHPGASSKVPCHGKKELELFTNKLKDKYKNFHIVNTSIYDLMSKSLFTACINAGTMVDNFTTLTPVLSCGKMLFTNSGAIIYNPNLEQGLDTMLNKEYDWEEMRLQQLKMLHWLNNTLIQEHSPVEENLKRFEFHSGVKF